MVQHTSLSIGQGFVPMRLDYIPFLRTHLLRPLLAEGKDGIAKVDVSWKLKTVVRQN
jgi:hypothetical protein